MDLSSGQNKARFISRMFARISRRYDLMNTVMTAGMHYKWRRIATALTFNNESGRALDLASGTGDFAVELAREQWVSEVVALDNTLEMLDLALEKAMHKEVSDKIKLVVGDAHNLPFPDNSFNYLTVGFGIRNFVNLPMAFREMLRVVKPGGRVVILEIVKLDNRGIIQNKLISLYFRYMTPVLGMLVAGDREAYTYLPRSVQQFLKATELANMMSDAGMINVSYRTLALGTVAIHIGEKS